MYYDFEAAVAYPCTAGQNNPPLRESVYDSDDETKGFFLSLEENPSLHPTLHRRSISPERDALRSLGRPVYRHRPKTTFAEYLAEFRNKAPQDGQVAPKTALTAEHTSPFFTDMKNKDCASKPDYTPSPPHFLTGDASPLPAQRQNEKDKVMPQRRPRRTQTSSDSSKTEYASNHKKLLQQGHRNPARLRQRASPPVPPVKATSAHRVVGCTVNHCTMVDMNANESDGTGYDKAGELNSNEIRTSYWKLSSLSRSDTADSSVPHEHYLPESDPFTVDLDFVKIMEEHNERLRKSKSERAGSSISARDQSDAAVGDEELLKNGISTYNSGKEPIKPAQMADQTEVDDRSRQLGLSNSESRNGMETKAIEGKGPSLADILEKENEKVLQERKKKLPERRRALQQNRRNALRILGQPNVAEKNRRINPISARVEFTTVQSNKPRTEIKSSNTAETTVNTARGLRPTSSHRGNLEGGSKDYLSQGRKPSTTSTVASKQNRATSSTLSKSHGPPTLMERTVSQPKQRAVRKGRQFTASTTSAPCKDEQDDLTLLLSQHNSKIRKNRILAATVND